MIVHQGRIRARDADEASVVLHERYAVRRMTLKQPLPGVYEYTVVVEEEVPS